MSGVNGNGFGTSRPGLALEFDAEGNALYIRVSDGAVARTQEVELGLLVDHDVAGGIVGFEVFGLERTRVGRLFERLERDYLARVPALRHLDALGL